MAIDYSTVGWQNDLTDLSDANFNHMDSGIKNACDGVDNLEVMVSQLNATKANETALAVERARIDQMQANPGSTSGDLALEDIKVGADGKTYDTPGNAVREQFNKISGDIAELEDITDCGPFSIWSENTSATVSHLGGTFRFFSQQIPSGAVISQDLEFEHSGGSGTRTIYIEFWEKSEKSIVKVGTKSHVLTSNMTSKEKVSIYHKFSNPGYVAILCSTSFLATVEGSGCMVSGGDANTSSIVISDIKSFTYVPNLDLSYKDKSNKIKNVFKKIGILENFVTVGAIGCDYTNIQDALDNINDSPTNHVTIMVMPGKYDKFSCGDFQFFSGNATPLRYVSIIGLDAKKTIVQSDLGDYRFPAAEIRANGLIKNITFIATHDSPYDDIENQQRKAYGVHMDMGSQDVEFENCIFISYQAPGVGIGLYQDTSVVFKNCESYSYAPAYDPTNTDMTTNFSMLANHGAFYCHSKNSDNVTNQRLVLDNCRFYSQNGDCGLRLQGLGTGTEFTAQLCNNIAISGGTGGVSAKLQGLITYDPMSYGNNFNVT